MNKRGLKKDGLPDLRGRVKTHGLTAHPLYDVWGGMKRRCYAKSHHAYKWYGGSGITVCEEWRNCFVSFYDWAIKNGWRKGLSIERIENNKGYSPNNCKFILITQQQANRRNVYKIYYLGKTQNLTEWCKELKIDYMLVLQRIRMGWGFHKSVTHPRQTHNRINNL